MRLPRTYTLQYRSLRLVYQGRSISMVLKCIIIRSLWLCKLAQFRSQYPIMTLFYCVLRIAVKTVSEKSVSKSVQQRKSRIPMSGFLMKMIWDLGNLAGAAERSAALTLMEMCVFGEDTSRSSPHVLTQHTSLLLHSAHVRMCVCKG